MQSFDEFLMENYEITEAGYRQLSVYEKRVIDREYEAHVNQFI